MDIKIPLPASALTTVNGKLDSLSLRLNQQLDVKVIEAKSNQNTLTLQLANKIIQVQSNQPVAFQAGQELTLQLIKLQPAAEFQIINLTDQTAVASDKQTASIILKQLQPSPAPQQTHPSLKQLVIGQQLPFKLFEITTKSLSGLLIFDTTTKTGSQEQSLPLTLSLKQIMNPAVVEQRGSASALALTSGQWLTLEVVKGGEQPLFKVVPNTAPVTIERIIAETIRQNLPIQDSATTLVNSLAELEKNADVPQLLQKLAREIMQNLPQRSQLSHADTLKQQIDNSGRFLEAKLIQLSTTPEINLNGDFKLKLLQLIQQLQQHIEPNAGQKTQPTELNLLREILQKSHGTLAKIILDQLNSLPREEGNKQTWTLELPFLNQQQVDNIAIQIEQENASAPTQAHNTWSVTITLTPSGLGAIHCKLHCYDSIVSTRFWSEQATTVAKINRHLDYLRRQLENNGIHAGLIEAVQGQPPQPATAQLSGQKLLNEEV